MRRMYAKRLIQDSFVLVSAVCNITGVVLWMRFWCTWRTALRSGNANLIEQIMGTGQSGLAVVLVGSLLASIPFLALWGWMVVDSVTRVAQEPRRQQVIWLVLLFVIMWSAWPYYLLIYRARSTSIAREGAESEARQQGDP